MVKCRVSDWVQGNSPDKLPHPRSNDHIYSTKMSETERQTRQILIYKA